MRNRVLQQHGNGERSDPPGTGSRARNVSPTVHVAEQTPRRSNAITFEPGRRVSDDAAVGNGRGAIDHRRARFTKSSSRTRTPKRRHENVRFARNLEVTVREWQIVTVALRFSSSKLACPRYRCARSPLRARPISDAGPVEQFDDA